jgi:dihydrofolate reductase
MIVSIIAAVADNGVIGGDNRLLWHIPADLRHFKTMTLGKPVIMGRRTYDSIGRALPGRDNLVVTRNAAWRAEATFPFPSLDAALASRSADEDVMVIGGGELYALALPLADRLYLTEVHRAYDGDIRFPSFDPTVWVETSRQRQAGDPDYSWVTLERVHA